LLAALLAALGEPVTGQIDDIPLIVDKEMIDEQCFSRCGTGLGQGFAPCEHVDERRLAHIAAPDEGVLRQTAIRTLAIIAIADLEFGRFDFHLL